MAAVAEVDEPPAPAFLDPHAVHKFTVGEAAGRQQTGVGNSQRPGCLPGGGTIPAMTSCEACADDEAEGPELGLPRATSTPTPQSRH